ncbi:MAG: hypothetical protein IPJ85_12575 [Flavobacteriales bacterium]|nr:hypothetical protein [Flavobacteriales bacterium]
MKRLVVLTLLLAGAATLSAQPGLRPMQVAFALYHEGRMVSVEELRERRGWSIRMENEPADIGVFGYKGLAYAEFNPMRSDPMFHGDTLWMTISHEQDRMRIAFPPLKGVPRRQHYGTHGLWIDFRPGDFLATDLPRKILVKGTIRNLREIHGTFPYELLIGCGSELCRSDTFKRRTGDFETALKWQPVSDHASGAEWVDILLVTRNAVEPLDMRMTIRVLFHTQVDLGEFDFVPARFRKLDNRAMVIEANLPRDTVITGTQEGTALHITAINLEAGERLVAQPIWNGPGEPLIHSWELVERPADGIKELRFIFAEDTNVAWESEFGPRPIESPPLPAGHYVLTQKAVWGKGMRNVDFLIGREVPFTVQPRRE